MALPSSSQPDPTRNKISSKSHRHRMPQEDVSLYPEHRHQGWPHHRSRAYHDVPSSHRDRFADTRKVRKSHHRSRRYHAPPSRLDEARRRKRRKRRLAIDDPSRSTALSQRSIHFEATMSDTESLSSHREPSRDQRRAYSEDDNTMMSEDDESSSAEESSSVESSESESDSNHAISFIKHGASAWSGHDPHKKTTQSHRGNPDIPPGLGRSILQKREHAILNGHKQFKEPRPPLGTTKRSSHKFLPEFFDRSDGSQGITQSQPSAYTHTSGAKAPRSYNPSPPLSTFRSKQQIDTIDLTATDSDAGAHVTGPAKSQRRDRDVYQDVRHSRKEGPYTEVRRNPRHERTEAAPEYSRPEASNYHTDAGVELKRRKDRSKVRVGRVEHGVDPAVEHAQIDDKRFKQQHSDSDPYSHGIPPSSSRAYKRPHSPDLDQKTNMPFRRLPEAPTTHTKRPRVEQEPPQSTAPKTHASRLPKAPHNNRRSARDASTGTSPSAPPSSQPAPRRSQAFMDEDSDGDDEWPLPSSRQPTPKLAPSSFRAPSPPSASYAKKSEAQGLALGLAGTMPMPPPPPPAPPSSSASSSLSSFTWATRANGQHEPSGSAVSQALRAEALRKKAAREAAAAAAGVVAKADREEHRDRGTIGSGAAHAGGGDGGVGSVVAASSATSTPKLPDMREIARMVRQQNTEREYARAASSASSAVAPVSQQRVQRKPQQQVIEVSSGEESDSSESSSSSESTAGSGGAATQKTKFQQKTKIPALLNRYGKQNGSAAATTTAAASTRKGGRSGPALNNAALIEEFTAATQSGRGKTAATANKNNTAQPSAKKSTGRTRKTDGAAATVTASSAAAKKKANKTNQTNQTAQSNETGWKAAWALLDRAPSPKVHRPNPVGRDAPSSTPTPAAAIGGGEAMDVDAAADDDTAALPTRHDETGGHEDEDPDVAAQERANRKREAELRALLERERDHERQKDGEKERRALENKKKALKRAADRQRQLEREIEEAKGRLEEGGGGGGVVKKKRGVGKKGGAGAAKKESEKETCKKNPPKGGAKAGRKRASGGGEQPFKSEEFVAGSEGDEEPVQPVVEEARDLAGEAAVEQSQQEGQPADELFDPVKVAEDPHRQDKHPQLTEEPIEVPEKSLADDEDNALDGLFEEESADTGAGAVKEPAKEEAPVLLPEQKKEQPIEANPYTNGEVAHATQNGLPHASSTMHLPDEDVDAGMAEKPPSAATEEQPAAQSREKQTEPPGQEYQSFSSVQKAGSDPASLNGPEAAGQPINHTPPPLSSPPQEQSQTKDLFPAASNKQNFPSNLQSIIGEATKESPKKQDVDRSANRRESATSSARELAQRNAARREQALANSPLNKPAPSTAQNNLPGRATSPVLKKTQGAGARVAKPATSALRPPPKRGNKTPAQARRPSNRDDSDLLLSVEQLTSPTTPTATRPGPARKQHIDNNIRSSPEQQPRPRTTTDPDSTDIDPAFLADVKTPTTPHSVITDEDKDIVRWRNMGLKWEEVRMLYLGRTGKRFTARGIEYRYTRVLKRFPELAEEEKKKKGKKGEDSGGEGPRSLTALAATTQAKDAEQTKKNDSATEAGGGGGGGEGDGGRAADVAAEQAKWEEHQRDNPQPGGKRWDPNAYEQWRAHQDELDAFLTDAEPGDDDDDSDDASSTATSSDADAGARTATEPEPEPLAPDECWYQYQVLRKTWYKDHHRRRRASSPAASHNDDENNATTGSSTAGEEGDEDPSAPTYVIGDPSCTTLDAANLAAGAEAMRPRFGADGIGPATRIWHADRDGDGLLTYLFEADDGVVVKVWVDRFVRAAADVAAGERPPPVVGAGWCARRGWVVCCKEVVTGSAWKRVDGPAPLQVEGGGCGGAGVDEGGVGDEVDDLFEEPPLPLPPQSQPRYEMVETKTERELKVLGTFSVLDLANREAGAALLDAIAPKPRGARIDAVERRVKRGRAIREEVERLEGCGGAFEGRGEVVAGGGGEKRKKEGAGEEGETVEVVVWVQEVALQGPRNL